MANFFTQFRGFDSMPKAMEGAQVKTITGSIVTVISSLLMLYIFIAEFAFYRTTVTTNHLYVDTTSGTKVEVFIDMNIHNVECSKLHIDVQDEKGEEQLEVHDDVKLVDEKDGCLLKGHLLVNKVTLVSLDTTPIHNSQLKGSCQIIFGGKALNFHQGSRNVHMHQFSLQQLGSFNASHTINRFSFGPDFPGLVNPLDNVSKVVEKGADEF